MDFFQKLCENVRFENIFSGFLHHGEKGVRGCQSTATVKSQQLFNFHNIFFLE